MSTRYDHYQNDTQLFISIYRKGIKEEDINVNSEIESLKVSVGQEVLIHLEPLFGQVDPEKTKHKIYGTKVEVVLSKAQATAWPTLTRSSSTPAPILSSNPIASSQATKTKPTRNKFDTFEDEEVEETPGGGKSEKDLEDFFKSLYGDLDEEGKRAMMKSFSESGGTVLSTDWNDIGKRKVEPQPPK